MHNTKIKMKDGREYESPIRRSRPIEGYLVLMGSDEQLRLDDMVSAVTQGARPSGDDMDELDNLRRYMSNARKFGWDGVNESTELMAWEKVVDEGMKKGIVDINSSGGVDK